jgi:hypothetical protein
MNLGKIVRRETFDNFMVDTFTSDTAVLIQILGSNVYFPDREALTDMMTLRKAASGESTGWLLG